MKIELPELFTVEFPNDFKAGDTFTAGFLFPGMSDEPVIWVVDVVTAARANAWATWCGAVVGRYSFINTPEGTVIKSIR